MITVPATVGVKIRRNKERCAASANWNRDEMTTRVASIPGPPWAIAAIQTEMKAPEVPIRRTQPAPMRPSRTACNIVVTPLTTTAAKTAQERNSWAPPAARITITGVSTTPATLSMASCAPRPRDSENGGLSSGSYQTREFTPIVSSAILFPLRRFLYAAGRPVISLQFPIEYPGPHSGNARSDNAGDFRRTAFSAPTRPGPQPIAFRACCVSSWPALAAASARRSTQRWP